MIYLDYAATTPVNKEVFNVIKDAMLNHFANPSSIYQSGKHNRHVLNEQRTKLKQILNIDEGELYFTSGATEANNWAIIAQALKARELNYGNHIISTAVEHPSVLATLNYLEELGFEVTYLHPQNLSYSAQQFVEATKEQTIGWVAMWVNNELGTLLPVEEIGKKAKELVKWFHVDAVQRFGHDSIDLSKLFATSISASGHKLYAPKGIGFLYYNAWDAKMDLHPLIHGGGQEKGMRSGTENFPYILGLVKAFELANTYSFANAQALEQYLFSRLYEEKIEFERNGKDHIPYIVNLYFPHFLSSQLLIQMDLANIAISAGSACSAGSLEVSHVLKAYYPGASARHHQSVRLSFGQETTKEDLDNFIKQLKLINERKVSLWHSQL